MATWGPRVAPNIWMEIKRLDGEMTGIKREYPNTMAFPDDLGSHTMRWSTEKGCHSSSHTGTRFPAEEREYGLRIVSLARNKYDDLIYLRMDK